GTSKAVRVLKKLTETPSVRPGAWSPRQVTLAGVGLGATAGAALGAGYGALKGRSATAIDGLRRILDAQSPKDAAAAIKAFDTTWGRHPGIHEFLTRLETMADQRETFHENDPELETNMRLRPNAMYGERPGEDIHPLDLPTLDPEDIRPPM